MSDARTEFATLMRQARAGDRAAMERVHRRYGGLVRAVVRRKLDQRLRRVYDSQDVAQDVWASFVHLPPEAFRFETPEELASYLARLAEHKAADAYRERLGAARHDLDRELHADEGRVDWVPGREPTPSQVVGAEERREQIFDNLNDVQRQIVELLSEEHTHADIARRLGVPTKAIQRIVRALKERLKL